MVNIDLSGNELAMEDGSKGLEDTEVEDNNEDDDDLDKDSQGNHAPFQPGDRIVSRQVPWRGIAGKIVKQRMHWDGGERFWGNCVTEMDNGKLVEWNCWQLDREEGYQERWAAEEAKKAAEVEQKERAELARLKAKYEA